MELIVIERAGVDVLPWFQPESAVRLEHGTRLCSFLDYHTAPQGTRVRLGRKGGVGQVLIKVGDAWRPEGADDQPGLTAYGAEGKPGYVEWAEPAEPVTPHVVYYGTPGLGKTVTQESWAASFMR